MNFLSILGLIFITLKLMGVITWSWWLVTLPLWGGIVLAGLFVIALIVAAVDDALNK